MIKKLKTLDVIVAIAVIIAVVTGGSFLIWLLKGTPITINNGGNSAAIYSTLSGQQCAHPTRRPIAVMLESDKIARPLSGLGEADMVFEMPVTPNGITRLMAVFQCQDPKEIGAIRSSRGSFIPLVQGLHAIYAHWGGERDALALLNSGAMDNVDALKYEGTTYYRKDNLPRPHNGFTTLDRVRAKAAELGYTASLSIDPYTHADQTPEKNISSLVDEASVSWPQGMDADFKYDSTSNTYLRWRGGTPEIDATTNQQVRASVVIIMKTDAKFLYDQYISVRTTGQGIATIYQNGRSIAAIWKKPTAIDMLNFVDSQGKPIPLARGLIWVLVDAPLPQP